MKGETAMKRFLVTLLCVMMLSSYAVAETLTNLPISEEKITLTFFWPQAGDLGELSSPNDGEFFQHLEEITNIHIDWILPASGSEETAYQLLFTSSEMPDIVQERRLWAPKMGQDSAIEEGYFVDLNNYLDCMPNYMAFLEANPDYVPLGVTDSGKRYAMYQSFYRPCETENGICIRKDLLDAVGMDIPVTYDDWYKVLKAFKDELNVYAPLYLMNNGATTYNEWSAGYGVAQSFFQINGSVHFGAIMEGWKEYLTMMNQWYAEGLLDPDFMARTGEAVAKDTELLYSNNIGAWYDYTTRMDNNYVSRGAQDPNFSAVGVTPPVKNVGDMTHLRSNDIYTSAHYAVSATSEHIEEAVRWLDNFYAWDTAQDANYGMVDGRSFVYGEDGKRYINADFRYNNPEGVSSTAFFAKYGMKDPPLRIQDFQQDIFLPLQRQSMENWVASEYDWNMPTNLTLTADESIEYNAIMADVTTYVNECAVSFITGTKSFDEWDSYVKTIQDMGIENATIIQKDALDRYNKR